ncbi:MAG: HD-GYP domain-containing protein, partial [Pyrinomonadaceae bacterium]
MATSSPSSILRKPGPLTGEEYAEMRAHSNLGADMISRIDGLTSIVPWVRHSHEHWDGTGYPQGLREARIPLPSRILLVADALDAMT